MSENVKGIAFMVIYLLAFNYGFSQTTALTTAEKEQIKIQENFDQWKGLGFGMAVGLAFPSKSIIESYEIVGDKIRIKSDRTAIGQVMLESHYFFPVRRPIEASSVKILKEINKTYIEALKSDNKDEIARLKAKFNNALDAYETQKRIRGVGVGPFICFVPGTDKIFKAIGVGGMIGLRRGNTSNSFNIGIGYINYSDVKLLPETVKDGDVIADITKDITIQSNVGGYFILFSFSF